MTESQQLLAEYVRNGSEVAFKELVARYVDLVYSAALRLVEGDPHRARDVAQTVFADLARVAPKLAPNSMLGGWLHRRACFVARTAMRGERRRQARERQAAEMNALENQPDTALAEIAPALDEAINELGADDRDVILLRFFEQRSLRTVGEALGTSENVAQKRVARALQELAGLLRHRGFTIPAAVLASCLTLGAVKAAPAGLALALAKGALAGSSASAGMGVASANAVALTKLKIAAAILLLAGISTMLLVQHFKDAKRNAAAQASQLPNEGAPGIRLIRPGVNPATELSRNETAIGPVPEPEQARAARGQVLEAVPAASTGTAPPLGRPVTGAALVQRGSIASRGAGSESKALTSQTTAVPGRQKAPWSKVT